MEDVWSYFTVITPGYTLTATERVLPRLALDFTTASLDPRVTVARTTGASNPATYINSNGYVTDATNNQPRFDFNPTTLLCSGLLIEESRANLLTQSSGYGAVVWIKANISISSTTETSPSNAANATKLLETAVTNTHNLQYTNGTTIGQTQTLSFFVKAAGRTRVAIGDGGINRSIYELTGAGSVVATGTGSTPGITAYGSDWYRITDTRTWASATPYLFLVESGTTVSYLGDITKGILVWGAQLEAGAFATSYIPTTTTSLTRNSDVVSMTGTNFSDWYNATEGTISVQAVCRVGTGSNYYYAITDGTINNAIYGFAAASNGSVRPLYVYVSGAPQATLTSTVNCVGTYTLTASYKANNFLAAVSGNAPTTDTAGTLPTVDRMSIGCAVSNIGQLNGHIAKLNYWPMQLTSSEVRAFSK